MFSCNFVFQIFVNDAMMILKSHRVGLRLGYTGLLEFLG